MTTMRCSEWTRAEAVDPIGTAGTYSGFVLIEQPLPWPADIADVPELASLVAAATAAGCRVQAVVPEGEARRTILYRRPDREWFSGYALAGVTGEPRSELLLCTHGRRDVCCGARGTALAAQLTHDAGPVRLWRTSHLGGHRFAPTAVVLPEGTAWAFLDEDALRRITTRRGSLDDLLPRYRGNSGLGPAAVQALERQAFAEVGWEWLEWRRKGEVDADGVVRLDAISPTGEAVTWTARSGAGRGVPVPVCGRPIHEATKTDHETTIESVERGRTSSNGL